MRIAFFVDNFLGSTGGIQNSIHRFKVGLESLGHEVAVFTDDKPGAVDERSSQIHVLSAIHTPQISKQYSGINVPIDWYPKDVIQFQPDIIHAHKHSPLGYLARHCATKLGVPFLYTFHVPLNRIWKYYHPLDAFGVKIAQIAAFEICKSSDAVIAPGEPIKRFICENLPGVKVIVVPTGVDTERFATPDGDFRKVLKIPRSTFLFLNVQRAWIDKRQDFLLRAYSIFRKKPGVPDSQFVIASEGPYRTALESLVKELGISKNVTFLGNIPMDKLVGLYQSSDAFLMASVSETQGLVPLEAAAAGLPIIAVDDETLRYCIKDGKNGIMTPDNPEAYADAMYRLSGDKRMRQIYKKASPGIAAEFSLEKQATKLLRVYENVLTDRKKFHRTPTKSILG